MKKLIVSILLVLIVLGIQGLFTQIISPIISMDVAMNQVNTSDEGFAMIQLYQTLRIWLTYILWFSLVIFLYLLWRKNIVNSFRKEKK